MDYFSHSQSIRQKISSSPLLLAQARKAFEDAYEPFNSGGTVNLFYVGDCGLPIALRIFRRDVPEGQKDLERQIGMMERYCQNAEQLHAQGERVPAFCVAAIYQERTGIFTEDLSAQGTKEIRHAPDDDHAWITDATGTHKVFVDIDHLFRPRFGVTTKYFLDDHVIRL